MIIGEKIILIVTMKAKNQLVVISGIIVLFATATIATSSYIGQPANAQTSPGNSGSAYGNQVIKGNAQCGQTNSCDGGAANWGGAVSSAAQDPSGHGIGDFRANGCKNGVGTNNGQGSPGVC